MTYKQRMTRMVAALIVGWVIVVGTGVGVAIVSKFGIVLSVGVLILVTSTMLAGTITLLVGMIGAFIIYVEHKLNGRENKNDIN